MIKAEGLGYHSRKFKMQDVSFELEDGYILTLLGRNGAGKTTLLDMLYGVLKPNKGHVYWNDVDVTGGPEIGALIIHGFIDVTKLPEAPTATMITALKQITFIGTKDDD